MSEAIGSMPRKEKDEAHINVIRLDMRHSADSSLQSEVNCEAFHGWKWTYVVILLRGRRDPK